ncbi:FliA/WhiG family RNA polymerase sigma factor [Gorillibacterium timonense]|uniref:FliA/WhiG family RNA polymerase sigma factor n=1 Tax=Gorillibacterium timonense TaxID=1689269 RepID=UPI00071D6F3E|nr:FliA/WhiG family RNA polymerase sigma factor [Gorillibacterium timonense]
MKESGKSLKSGVSLWKRWKEEGDENAKKELIESYLSLVDYAAGRLAIGLPKSVAKEDLISTGILGLIDAIEKFDYERGLQFETYASWRIRGAMIDGLRQNDWVPRSVREKAKKIEDAYQKLEQQYMRSVSDLEMSEFLGVNESDFRQMLQEVAVSTISSIDEPVKDDEYESRLAYLVDEKARNPDYRVNEFFQKETLAKAIDRLTEKERTVVSLFYYEELSLSEIAEVMSLSPSRISQLHSKAILRLRGSLNRLKGQLLSD